MHYVKMMGGRQVMTIESKYFFDMSPSKGGLIKCLIAEGHVDLAWCVSVGAVGSLSTQRKQLLNVLASNYKSNFKYEATRRQREAMLVTTSSGWSREPDAILPGGRFVGDT